MKTRILIDKNSCDDYPNLSMRISKMPEYAVHSVVYIAYHNES